MNYIDHAVKNLEQICLDCRNYKTEDCIKAKCNIGFALKVMEKTEENKVIVIEDGLRLIPKEDMKHYEKAMVASCTAAICKNCKQCMKGHNENCSVSLARKSIEGIVLKEIIDYPGNILGYIIKVAEQDQDFADLVKNEIEMLD